MTLSSRLVRKGFYMGLYVHWQYEILQYMDNVGRTHAVYGTHGSTLFVMRVTDSDW